MSEEQKKTFKAIALIPREGCKLEYLKVLKVDQPYYFYRNYKVGPSEELIETTYLTNLFNKEDPHIEITAIVGKNGSGKSTVMELFFMIINNLTFRYENIRRDLVYVNEVYADFYFLSDRFYKIVAKGELVEVFAYSVDQAEMVPESKFDFESLF